MSYFLIFIISLLLNIFPLSDIDQTKVKVTFESASLVYDNSDESQWSYSSTINDFNVSKNEVFELVTESADKITFMVSVVKPNDNLKKSKEGAKTTFNALFIDDLKVEDPATLNTYGSNPVTISINELLSKKPGSVNIFVDVKEDKGNKLVGSSTKFVFNFKLEYE